MSDLQEDFDGQEIPIEDAEEQTEVEDTEEEIVETDESDDGDSTEEDDESLGGDSEDEELDVLDYIKSKGIEVEDFDEFIEDYKKSKPDLDNKSKQIQQIEAVLEARGFKGGLQGLLSGEVFEGVKKDIEPRTPEEGGGFFSESPFSDAFKEIEYQVTDPNTKTFYQQFNKIADKALAPQFKKMEEVYSVLVENVIATQKAISDVKWETLQHPGKKMVTKEQFEAAAKTYKMNDPKKIMDLLAISNPELLKTISEKAEKKGIEKGKKFRKFSKGMKRGKAGIKSGGVNWKAYYNSDGSLNRGKLEDSGLTLAQQVAILDAAEKATKPRG